MLNHYPLWKNILLVVALIVAIIYALPNLFGNDQAVQVSTTGTALITDDTLTKAQQALTADHIKYLSSDKQDDKLLIRFADTDTQLKAIDVIKTTLGDDYVVALNLASRTPKWLQALGAYPMKLGLDLCGGVHFLQEVD